MEGVLCESCFLLVACFARAACLFLSIRALTSSDRGDFGFDDSMMVLVSFDRVSLFTVSFGRVGFFLGLGLGKKS